MLFTHLPKSTSKWRVPDLGGLGGPTPSTGSQARRGAREGSPASSAACCPSPHGSTHRLPPRAPSNQTDMGLAGMGFRVPPKKKNDSVRTALGLEVREPYMISPELRLKEPERWRPDEDGVRLPEILPKLILVEALAGGPSAGGTLGPHLFVSL